MLAKSPHDRFSEPAEIAELLAPYAQHACLERLVSNELCYGLANSAAQNGRMNQTWNQRLHHALVEGPRAAERLARRAWPRDNSSAAQRRRRPLALAGVVGAVSLFGSVLVLQRHDSPPPPETVATTGVVHRASAETRSADPTERPAPQPQAVHAPREQPVARTTLDRTAELAPTANMTKPTTRPLQQPASAAPPRATVRTLARPVSHGTRMMAPVTVTADSDDSTVAPPRNQPSGWTAFPGGKNSGGAEYRVIKSGTGPHGFDPRMMPPGFDPTKPPPGFDATKFPPIPDRGMPPPWILDQLPPAPGVGGR